MTKEELLGFINGEGKDMFSEITSELGLSKIDKNTVEKYFTTDEGKSLLFSKYDTEHNRRMKKYKEEGGFAKDFDEEFKKRNPQMTETEKELMDLKTKNAEYERREVIRNNYKELSSLNENYNLPSDVLELLINENLEDSRSKIEKIGSGFSQHVTSLIEKGITDKLGSSAKPLPTNTVRNITLAEYESMSKADRMNVPMEQLEKILGGK